MNKYDVLKNVFGYESFRSGQEEIIDTIMDSNIRGVLAVLPTGRGKSLLFQIPSILSDGLSIVISPLISLMKNQVDVLKSKGISADLYNSSLNAEEKREVIEKLRNKEIKLLYVAPERFDDSNFMEILKENKISIFAIDEAHSISTWSDFRPSYRRLKKAIFELQPQQIVGLTATATKRVQQDICNQMGAPNAKRYIMGFSRSDLNINISFSKNDRFGDVIDEVKSYVEDGIKTGLVYVGKRADAESIANVLKKEHEINASFYHAGMKSEERTETQNKWFEKNGIIVCSTAFAMGIDKPDVRFVLHSYIPSSIEEYYQHIGRASRDGLGADCKIITSIGEDTNFLKWMIDIESPPVKNVQAFWKWLNYEAKRTKGKVAMTQEKMGNLCGLRPASQVGGCISYLKKCGLVNTLEKGLYDVNYFDNHLDAPIDYEILYETRKAKQEKMYDMIDYVQNKDTCKMVTILNYFGEPNSKPCGKCYVCRKKGIKWQK